MIHLLIGMVFYVLLKNIWLIRWSLALWGRGLVSAPGRTITICRLLSDLWCHLSRTRYQTSQLQGRHSDLQATTLTFRQPKELVPLVLLVSQEPYHTHCMLLKAMWKTSEYLWLFWCPRKTHLNTQESRLLTNTSTVRWSAWICSKSPICKIFNMLWRINHRMTNNYTVKGQARQVTPEQTLTDSQCCHSGMQDTHPDTHPRNIIPHMLMVQSSKWSDPVLWGNRF